MSMVNRSYRIGYNFERRVIKKLEADGWFVVRSGKSKFPDFVALKRSRERLARPIVIIGECKVNKYLSREEKAKGGKIFTQTGVKLIVYWRDGRKIKSYSPDLNSR